MFPPFGSPGRDCENVEVEVKFRHENIERQKFEFGV